MYDSTYTKDSINIYVYIKYIYRLYVTYSLYTVYGDFLWGYHHLIYLYMGDLIQDSQTDLANPADTAWQKKSGRPGGQAATEKSYIMMSDG